MQSFLRIALNSKSLLLAIVFAGCYFRVYGYSFQTYWFDELFSLALAQLDSIAKIHQRFLIESNPPLFVYLLHFWLKLSDAFYFPRFLTIVFSILHFFSLAYISKKHLKGAKAFLFLFLSAFSSGYVYYAVEVRSYSLLLLFSAWMFHFFLMELSLEKKKSGAQRFFFFLFCILSAQTHYFGFLLSVFLIAYLFFLSLLQKTNAWKAYIFGTVVFFLSFALELDKILFQNVSKNTNWIQDISLLHIFFFTITQIVHTTFGKSIYPFLLFWLSIFVLCFKSISEHLKTDSNLRSQNQYSIFEKPNIALLLIVTLGFLSLFGLHLYKPILTSRNLLIFSFPIYFLLADLFPSDEKLSNSRFYQILLLLVVVSYSLSFQFFTKDFRKIFKEDFQSGVAYIYKSKKTQAPILIANPHQDNMGFVFLLQKLNPNPKKKTLENAMMDSQDVKNFLETNKPSECFLLETRYSAPFETKNIQSYGIETKQFYGLTVYHLLRK